MLNRGLSSLFIPKYKINPMINILRNIRTLQLLSHSSNKLIRILMTPLGQLHIINSELVLRVTIIIVVYVYKHFRKRIDLGD